MSFWDDYDHDKRPDITVECKHCGAGNLLWEEDSNGGYFLVHPDGRVHKCDPARVHKRRLEGFEDVS